MGDFVNFTNVSRYPLDPHYKKSFSEELDDCRSLFYKLVSCIRKANPDCVIEWIEGNHEERLSKYLVRDSVRIALMEDEQSEEMLTVPYLFKLHKNNVKWIPATQVHVIHGHAIVEHGDVSRLYSGYTAKAMIDKRNMSGFSGHTHRMAYTFRKTYTDYYFWIETGCMCNLQPEPSYVKSPNWQNGWVVGSYNKEKGILYPTVIPIINNSFYFEGKLYA